MIMDSEKKLIVKYLKQGEDQKILTTIKGKVYFSKNQNMVPGYYVGKIEKEDETFGIFDAVPLNQLPVAAWANNKVAGVFVKANRRNKQLRIYVSKLPEYREEKEEPIHIIDLSEKEAEEIWGNNYKSLILKRKNGIKTINVKSYTPLENLKSMMNRKN